MVEWQTHPVQTHSVKLRFQLFNVSYLTKFPHFSIITHWDDCFSCVCWDSGYVLTVVHKHHTYRASHQYESSYASSGCLLVYTDTHTYHTYKGFRRCEHACVSSDHQLVYTYTRKPHIWMEVPLCVSSCELSSDASSCNIFHIPCTWMVFPLCEFVDVLWSVLFGWNFYHNAHMWRAYYHCESSYAVRDVAEYPTPSRTPHICVSSDDHSTHRLHYTLLLVSSCITSCV